METYTLNFEGYWREQNKSGLPNYSGIYMVYRCTYNPLTDRVTLIEIIYIGKANNIHERHVTNTHERLEDFKSKCLPGEELCYSCAHVSVRDLDIVENALIFAQKPVLNTDEEKHYNHEDAHFIVDGQCACLKYTNFTIS